MELLASEDMLGILGLKTQVSPMGSDDCIRVEGRTIQKVIKLTDG